MRGANLVKVRYKGIEIEGSPEEVVQVLKLLGAIERDKEPQTPTNEPSKPEVSSKQSQYPQLSRRFNWKQAELEAYREAYG